MGGEMDLAQSVEDVTKIARGDYTTTGILLLILLAIGLAVWRFSDWSGGHINTLVQQLSSLVSKLNMHLDSVGETLKSILKNMDSQSEDFTEVRSTMHEIHRKVETLMDQHSQAKKRGDVHSE